MSNLTILYRGRDFERDELEAAKDAGFECLTSRVAVGPGSMVVARYSALPYYEELRCDIEHRGSLLVNSFRQHRYVADMKEWYSDLKDLTFETWSRLEDVPEAAYPVVLKGETNSRKFFWNEQMFADTRAKAVEIYRFLMNDGLIGEQQIYIRRFEPLVTYFEGFHGLPITKEFRFFCVYGQVLSGGFYWSSHAEELREKLGYQPSISEVPREFLETILKRIGNNVAAVVVDVAQSQSGAWRLVELNDLQMSGLSENDPKTVYSNLSRVLRGQDAIFWETLGTNAG